MAQRSRSRIQVSLPIRFTPTHLLAPKQCQAEPQTAAQVQHLDRMRQLADQKAYKKLLGENLEPLTGVPREAELKLGDVSSQASLAFNVLASVLGGGFVGYWLAGNISSDIMVRLVVGVVVGMTLLIVESVLLVTRLSAMDAEVGKRKQ